MSKLFLKFYKQKKYIFTSMQSIYMLVQSIAWLTFSVVSLLFLCAIDLHKCAIDCSLVKNAYVLKWNWFASLCNRFLTENIWIFWMLEPVQSICIKGAVDCLLNVFEKQQLWTYLFIAQLHGIFSFNLGNCSLLIFKNLCCFKGVLWTYKY